LSKEVALFSYHDSQIDKPWWRSGDKTDPFNGGVLYIKRKVGSCSYSDDPIGCQSLISRAMHEVNVLL
jgi:anaphase-promoting complex subunit 1